MKQKQTYKEISYDRKEHYGELAENKPDQRATERFRQPAYQAQHMIQVQGSQMRSKTVAEYVAERYNIGGGDKGGQAKA